MNDAQPALRVEGDAKGRIRSHVCKKWLVETPEERVRQEFLTVLVNEYGYALEQISEEESVPSVSAARRSPRSSP